jgi:glutamate synthase (NADPH/NADH) large chain
VLTKELGDEGLRVLAWRVVPTNTEVLGEIALQSLPVFEQVIVNCPMGVTEVEFNRKLFMARRRAEQKLYNDASFYVTTLSSNVISYKGLMMPAAIADFYTDLADERLESHIVVFHQRFSTNTLPRWQLAQPFRYLHIMVKLIPLLQTVTGLWHVLQNLKTHYCQV